MFAGILLLSQASPGPDQAFVTRSTLAYGFGAGVMAALGIGTGIVAHAALACTVGASVFHSFLGVGLFCAASCWMLYLAWKIWPRGRNAFLAGCGDIPPASGIYRDALVTNLMNPKATFFFVALSAPVGSMSLDFQVASLPYKSSSFATSRGNEKIGGTGYCVTYDTDSQSRNVLASPLGEEGHEVAKGWTVVILIMILDVDVTAEGGIIKLIALRAIPQPSGPKAPSNLRTLGPKTHPS